MVNIPQNSYSSVTGQDVQIPCSVSANPTATITWTFISTSQSQTSITTSTSKYTFNPSSTDGTLRIRSTSSSDTGTYRCQATNAVGTASDSASLSVSGSECFFVYFIIPAKAFLDVRKITKWRTLLRSWYSPFDYIRFVSDVLIFKVRLKYLLKWFNQSVSTIQNVANFLYPLLDWSPCSFMYSLFVVKM